MKIGFYGDSFIDCWQDIIQRKPSPEGNGWVNVLGEVFAEHPGGSANAARALTHFPVECLDLSPTPCEVKTRLMWCGAEIERLDQRLGPIADCREPFDGDCRGFEAMVVSDYCKGAVSEEKLKATLTACRVAGIPCVIDSKSPFVWPHLDYRGAVYKCNEAEIARVNMSFCAARLDDPTWLAEQIGCPVIVTRAAKSPLVSCCQTNVIADIRFPPQLPFQSSGAGDSFAAFLAFYLASGMSVRDAAEKSYIAAAAAGYFPPLRAPVLPREIEAIRDPARLKILATVSELTGWIKYRVCGSLCVTNGCFDLLHEGHVRNLQECGAQADQLLVLVNSDESIRQLKGRDRPIIPLAQRVRVLASLESVSAVASFDGDTPEKTLAAICELLRRKIDVLAKGSEYETAPGQQYADRYHRTPLFEARTCDIIQNIRESCG